MSAEVGSSALASGASGGPALGAPYAEVSAPGGVSRFEGAPDADFRYYAGGELMRAGWQWRGDTLRIYADPYGFLPLFYNVEGDRLRVSSSIPQLLAHGARRDLDDDALAVFLRIGSFVGNDTAFTSIRALAPGEVVTWTRGVVTGSIEHAPFSNPAASTGDVPEVVATYVELFRRALSSAPWSPESSLLPLSGGKDSRHILLELHATSRPPVLAATFEQLPWQEANLDVPIATALAARTGVRHTLLAQDGDPLGTEIEKNLLTSLCSDEHAHAMALVRFIRGSKHIIYDGIAGDVLSESKVRDGSWSEAIRAGRSAEVAAREIGPPGYLERMLTPEMAGRWCRERALGRLARELVRHSAEPNPFGAYRFWNRARRETALAPLAMLATDNTVCLPYLYPPLFEFLRSLPSSLLTGERIHTTAMRRAYPDFADIPFDHERDQPVAARYRAGPRRAVAARARLHSARWIAASTAYGLRETRWLKPFYTSLIAGRAVVQPAGGALPWLPRMLVYLGMLERLVRGDAAGTESDRLPRARTPGRR